jgi:hypothetical protein
MKVDQTEEERAALTRVLYNYIDHVYLNRDTLTTSPRQIEELLNDASSLAAGLQSVLPNGAIVKLVFPEGRNRDSNLANLGAIRPMMAANSPFGKTSMPFSAAFPHDPSMMLLRNQQYIDLLNDSITRCNEELLKDPPRKRLTGLRRRVIKFNGMLKELKTYTKFIEKELKSIGCGEKVWRDNPTWLSDYIWLRLWDSVKLNRWIRVSLYGGTEHFPESNFGADTLNLAVAAELATFRGRRKLGAIPSKDLMRILLLISGGDCRICGYRGCMREFCIRCNKSVAAAAPSTPTITFEYLCSHQNLIPERSRTYAAEDDGEEDA